LKRTIFFIISIILSIVFLGVIIFFAQKIYQRPEINQRHLFLKAEKALQKGESKKFQQLKKQLMSYPLYPYLTYDDIASRIDELPFAEVNAFFQNYSDTYAAKELRKDWLLALARQQKWQEYTNYYKKNKDPELQCLYANALYQTGSTKKAYALGKKLWLTPKSQVNACDTIFEIMKKNDALTDSLIWQRFLLTIKKGHASFAAYLKKALPSSKQHLAKRWLRVKQNPNQINNVALFPPHENDYNNILTYGLKKMGSWHPKRAVTAWHKLRKTHQFTHAQTQAIIQAIAIGYIKTTHKRSIPWLHQINPHYLNEISMNWRLRFALIEDNWRGLLHWINNLPAKERKASQWQYWRARALSQLGQQQKAKAVYQQVAKNRDYYGFLAAEKLGQPYPIHNKQLPISDEDYQRIQSHPGFLRAKELFALKRNNEGTKEWWHTLLQLKEQDRYIAARLANKNAWTPIALATTGFIAHQDDLQLRFPTYYLKAVKKQADRFDLDPAFIYAIIRQESMFNPEAESYAGAKGLMQLMPATANELINEDNMPKSYSKHLHKPKVNIHLGSQYLNRLMGNNGQSTALTAASYNAGPGRVSSWLPKSETVPADIWIDTIPYPETRNYVKNVLTYAIIYQYLMGGSPKITPLMPPVKTKD